MSITGLGRIQKKFQNVTLTNGEVKNCEVVYRLGWMFYQDRLVVAWIPVKACGMLLTNVRYESGAWTADQCRLESKPPQAGR